MEDPNPNLRRSLIRQWVRRGFIAWAIISTLWLLNSYRTQGVAPTLLISDSKVTVQSSRDALAFLPTSAVRSGLVFIVGAGVAAEAYAPLLRPLAEKGYPVFVVRLPYSIAPLEQHKKTAIGRVAAILGDDNAAVTSWVIAGHSLGAALACRIAATGSETVTAMVLIGTSHPKTIDLSHSHIRITKVYASNDGIATVKMINATTDLLPRDTRWIKVEGGNHSQFAHYGHQLFDGSPTIPREQQQDITRAALLAALEGAYYGEPSIPSE